MSRSKTLAAAMTTLALLQGCAETPMGPRVQVLPAPNKPFEVFQQEQAACQQYANSQVAGQADAANNRAVGEALIGTVLGAGLGAAVGGGHGAGVGAATGTVMGGAVGAGDSQKAQMGIQHQYDNAYAQCMYSKGNQVVQPQAPVRPIVVYPAAPPPAVIYAPPPQPPVIYAPPPASGYAPPPAAVGSPPPPPDQPPPTIRWNQ